MNSHLVLSAEERRNAEYEAFAGPNASYYAPRFGGFDSGAKITGWHWPAFFSASLWLLYRKMWAQALIYLLAIPFAALILGIAAGMVFGDKATVWVIGVATVLVWLAAPLFASFLYWRHARSEIDSVAARLVGDARLQEIERRGGTTWWGPVIALCSSLFFVGILAAIAIPAYQDYTIRSQVMAGLNWVAEIKLQVAEQYAAESQWPSIAEDAIDIGDSPYVDGLYVEDGSVVVRYGRKANPVIAGQSVAVTGGIDDAGEIVWICGNAAVPDGVRPAPGPVGSDISDRYLPKSCRTP